MFLGSSAPKIKITRIVTAASVSMNVRNAAVTDLRGIDMDDVVAETGRMMRIPIMMTMITYVLNYPLEVFTSS
jgi:hypothetical protein